MKSTLSVAAALLMTTTTIMVGGRLNIADLMARLRAGCSTEMHACTGKCPSSGDTWVRSGRSLQNDERVTMAHLVACTAACDKSYHKCLLD